MNVEDDLSGMVFDVQRFALHDGPGIRTTVFLKGCPLRCAWCHNPESMSPKPELLFDSERCVSCEACTQACLHIEKRQHDEHRFCASETSCAYMGKCADLCKHEALKFVGQKRSVSDVMKLVLKDRAYYTRSDGGMTISGGEPLQQWRFTLALLKEAKSSGLHTCLDTSGMAALAHLQAVQPFVDLFLFDYKVTGQAMHDRWTGGSEKLILDNLAYLDSVGAAIELRCPIIPGINDNQEHDAAICVLQHRFGNIRSVRRMPYHDAGRGKWAGIGRNALKFYSANHLE